MIIAIIGGGPSSLFAAALLLEKGHKVTLYEKTSSTGKKLLVAGKSGLNITHSEPIESFSKKYFEQQDLYFSLLQDFSNTDLIKWLNDLGVETFIGSSGRVFPTSFKASEILKIINDKLKTYSDFNFFPNSTLTQIDKDYIYINNEKIVADKYIYGLGGKSWKITGSDGLWIDLFKEHGIQVNAFAASNCGVEIAFKSNFDRTPIKNCSISIHGHTIQGDIMLTDYGLEGTPVYSLVKYIREDLEKNKTAFVKIDLKPDLTSEELAKKFSKKRSKDSLSNSLRKLIGLDAGSLNLLKEFTVKEEFQNSPLSFIKNLSIPIHALRPMDEAISTSGGVAFNELTEAFELSKLPNHYVIGEMVDFDTITGGYLLQACFSMAFRVSKSL